MGKVETHQLVVDGTELDTCPFLMSPAWNDGEPVAQIDFMTDCVCGLNTKPCDYGMVNNVVPDHCPARKGFKVELKQRIVEYD